MAAAAAASGPPTARDFQVILVDVGADMVRAFKAAFAGLPRVAVVHGRFEELPEFDCMTSAANSFGLMDGGIDAAITRYFPSTLQAAVQRRIADEYEGEQPVGTSMIVGTGDAAHPWLAHTPTMRVPYSVQGTDYPYLAMKALLTAVRRHNEAVLRRGGAGDTPAGEAGSGSGASGTSGNKEAGSGSGAGGSGAGGSGAGGSGAGGSGAGGSGAGGSGAGGSGDGSGTGPAPALPRGFIRSVAVPGLATGYGRVDYPEAARQMAEAYRAFLHPQPAHKMSWDFASQRQHDVGYGGLPGFARFFSLQRQRHGGTGDGESGSAGGAGGQPKGGKRAGKRG